MKFIVKGEQASVSVEIRYRPYPDSTDLRDINWIETYIEVNIPGYHAFFPATLSTYDLAEFLKTLKQMYSTLSGQTELSTIEDMIYLNGRIDKIGQITWQGRTTYPIGLGAILTFEFASDQSYLRSLIAEIEAVMREYPIIN